MGNTKPITKEATSAIQQKSNSYRNVFIFGLEGAGKTHLLYRRLAGSAFDTTLDAKLESTNGFNSELLFQDSCTFQAWDFGGSAQMREFWPFYTS